MKYKGQEMLPIPLIIWRTIICWPLYQLGRLILCGSMYISGETDNAQYLWSETK